MQRSGFLAAALLGVLLSDLATAGLVLGLPDFKATISSPPADAIVDVGFVGAEGSRVGGIKTFRSIKAALEDAPDTPRGQYIILIKDGRYREKIVVSKPRISFLGESRDATVLTYDAYSGFKNPDGTNLGTWKCGTLIIRAPDFHAENLTIENAFDYPSNDGKYADDPTRTNAPQAVALMTDQGSDRAFFRNLRINGYQDTLFVSSGRSYFTRCVISGHVDFIFGAGQAIFEEDDIVTRARRVIAKTPIGYITAPSTQIGQRFGLVFIACRLLKESAAIPSDSVALGRPWHPTTSFPDGRYADPNAVGSSVFLRCYMDDHIAEKGWDRMAGTGRKEGEKIWFNPEDARFFEYNNTGPGAHKNPSRRQLSDEEARDYTVESVLGGWHPNAATSHTDP